MLDSALKFLASQLTARIASATGGTPTPVGLSRVVDEAGKVLITEDSLALSLLHLEEERVMQGRLPEHTLLAGRYTVAPPELRLNLHVLLVANFRQYDEALRHLSMGVQYLHENPVFMADAYPDLGEGVDRLTVELLSLSYEQLNQVWGAIGSKLLPFAALRVRGVFLGPAAPTGVREPITTMKTLVQGR